MEERTFCQLLKDQLKDEDQAGELYETARKLLKEENQVNKTPLLTNEFIFAGAVLEKIASDERSHKILLRVLTERLCP